MLLVWDVRGDTPPGQCLQPQPGDPDEWVHHARVRVALPVLGRPDAAQAISHDRHAHKLRLLQLVSARPMTHPLIPSILELANPIAAQLELEVVGAVFYTNQSPPVLRVDIRNPTDDTSLENCEAMSHALEVALDESDLIPDAYVLEISSPGVPEALTTDREFVSFKGFPVTVTVKEPFKGHTTWQGQLIRRDETAVHLSKKGRPVAIPRSLILSVQLDDHPQSS